MIALIVTTTVAFLLIRRFDRNAQPMLWGAFGFHLLAAGAQVILTRAVLGGGDMLGYFARGMALRALLLEDFGEWAMPVLQIALGGMAYVPVNVIAIGSSTGAMTGLASWALLFANGSIYGACFYFATFAFFGQCALYQVFSEAFPAALHRRLLLALFFVPSVVFWSSGILKEAIALGGLGLCVLGAWRLLFTGHVVKGLAFGTVGAFTLSISKAYALGPLALAIGVWLYWTRRAGNWSPTALVWNSTLVLVAALASGYALTYLGELYPQYAVENIAAEAANLQGLYYQNEAAGSTYQFGEATQEAQLSYAPLALLSSLARPFIFEVHNVVSLIAAIEMSALLVMIALVVRKHRVRPLLKRAIRSPVIVFLAVFVCLFGLGVGLGAPNIGSLSRYRILMMPFYVLMIVAFLPHRSPG